MTDGYDILGLRVFFDSSTNAHKTTVSGLSREDSVDTERKNQYSLSRVHIKANGENKDTTEHDNILYVNPLENSSRPRKNISKSCSNPIVVFKPNSPFSATRPLYRARLLTNKFIRLIPLSTRSI
ncbi:hypothetical protein VN97_g10518 [Penicillium thymicola]|uniref:Uncharacterized protein n=1 Tax=Penicillium thymicola TaxID=293382 RepID=A0AAI9X3V1_PENTH|nr:hypothetical protein VN97_g10518 [Penicillium thymicola]